MTRISPKALNLIKRDSVEAKLSSIYEHVRNKGMEPVAVAEGHVYGLVVSEDAERIFKADVSAFFVGKGDIGEFEDVTEEYGLQEKEIERRVRRITRSTVEAVLSRDRAVASQHLRELLHQT